MGKFGHSVVIRWSFGGHSVVIGGHWWSLVVIQWSLVVIGGHWWRFAWGGGLVILIRYFTYSIGL
jgi:hypothetical protein